MAHKFAQIAFTDSVREFQQKFGSRAAYAAFDRDDEDSNHLLSTRETDFITARDSFYMASVSETGWPYLQHRGGPTGFVRVLDAQTIGFADFSGNRQYISVGNLSKDDRVSLFFMDYANRRRLKLLGRVRLIGDDQPERLAQLDNEDYLAAVERGFLIQVEAFDWNCPQHITPRYTAADIEPLIAPLEHELSELKVAAGVHQGTNNQILGTGPLRLVISGIRQLTPRVRAYELRPLSGGKLPEIEAGANLSVPVRLDGGSVDWRQYSICSNPARRDIYEIAVLRDEKSRGGSVALHAQFALGMQLNCELPQNHFALQRGPHPAVLIAGGIGITPIKSMAQALKARGNPFELHYAGRRSTEMAFYDRLKLEFGGDLRLYPADQGARLNIDAIMTGADAEAVFYICGPARLIDAASTAAAAIGIDADRLQFEQFSAASTKLNKPFVVDLKRSGRQIEVGDEQTMLDALIDAGVDVRFSCRAGNCRSCVIEVVGGEVDHRDAALSADERNQFMCPCVSRADGDHLVVNL